MDGGAQPIHAPTGSSPAGPPCKGSQPPLVGLPQGHFGAVGGPSLRTPATLPGGPCRGGGAHPSCTVHAHQNGTLDADYCNQHSQVESLGSDSGGE
eukprot:3015631-Rhodomonas_salina.1